LIHAGRLDSRPAASGSGRASHHLHGPGPPPGGLAPIPRSGRHPWNDVAIPRLRPMDRIFLAIIAAALLLLLGAAGLAMTRTADIMHHARTVGVAGTR
jgi:hypothetical protein